MTCMGNPLFSVIIPTYNRCQLVQESIESVMKQTFSSYEIIVVDDGSNDESRSYVTSRYGSKVTYFYQERLGPSAARNRGVEAAKGQYIAFLDSDDLWLPVKLERQMRYFELNPDILYCHTEEIWMSHGRRIYPKQKHQKAGGMIYDRALKLCLVSPSAVAIKKDLFVSVGGFDESFPAAEDYDLWLRLLHRYPIGFIEEPLVVKRAGSWEQLSFKTQAIDRYRIRALCKILNSGEITPDQVFATWNELVMKVKIYAKGCRKRNRESEALRFERLIEIYKPSIINGG